MQSLQMKKAKRRRIQEVLYLFEMINDLECDGV